MMWQDMLSMDVTSKHGKEQLKVFVKHRVGVRGDKVLWGKHLREGGQWNRQEGGCNQGGNEGPTGREQDDGVVPLEERFEDITNPGGGQADEPGGDRAEEITPE